TTTTTTTTITEHGGNTYHSSSSSSSSSQGHSGEAIALPSEHQYTNAATGQGCYPMDDIEYNNIIAQIEEETFSSDQIETAKQISKVKCLNAMQIKGILMLFDHDSDRLEYATFAYPYCSDPDNYYQLNPAFSFDSTVKELKEAIGQ
ncbi:MAG: DUF4476 domain-containing protein, partial [Saprospiraceae bacterium]|nr:DUF4476 domain-containing protein [Saprospiraceae bacterium]